MVSLSNGRSLKGLLQGKNLSVHDQPICLEHEGKRMMRQGQWKLVAYYNSPWALYNVDIDRSEASNLAEEQPDVVKKLSKSYNQ